MKALITAIGVFALGFGASAFAEDAPAKSKPAAKGTEYTVAMTGVTWGGCKKYVSSAFSKLTGVSNIKIAAGDKPGTQKVTFVSTSDKLNKKQAVKSLGDKATRFVVVDFMKSADAKKGDSGEKGEKGAKAPAGKEVTYTVAMTGVVWGGCKKSVRAAFSKLDGFKSVKFAAGDKPGTQKVTVVASSAKLDKKAAIKTLGKDAKKYVVVDFKKAS